MAPGEVTALITGISAVLAAAVTGFYLLRAAHAQRPPQEPPPSPPPITIVPTPSERPPQSQPPVPGKDSQPSAPADPSIGVRQPIRLPGSALSATPPLPAWVSDPPETRTLDLVPPDRSYKGLDRVQLDVEFITDAQFILKDGDGFIFIDNELGEI